MFSFSREYLRSYKKIRGASDLGPEIGYSITVLTT
jgi:hypothetical protein